MKFVAFGHRKNVGKSTAGKFLCTHLRITRNGSCIKQCSFAYKGKRVCHELYGWAGLKTPEYYEENPKEKDIVLSALGKSPRQIWIDFMSGVGRRIYEHTWVDFLFHTHSGDVGIISDLRFPNECERIHHHGGFVIKIERPGIVHVPDEADDPLEGYEGWDKVIVNDGSLERLHEQVIGISLELGI